ncbi:MMPL family transporter [Cellulomonas sp. SLBN-39]|uniref:MMPL family transporter n=1 Tax=Cellulomonas sp. SLBN-39 TaxID=2768446 RepID=UPI001150D13E|nr:MMPL family transporter [Cellulomonas sp. SLBN-39]TQL04230.1 RND superfamily putative drug exporter [Cellulomonas sp. SLBN-39]
MARVFARLGRTVALHPRIVVVAWLVLAVLGVALAGGVVGDGVLGRVTTATPVAPGSQSAQGAQVLADARTSGPSVTLVVQGVDPTVEGLDDALDPARTALAAIDGVVGVYDPLGLPDGIANPAAAPLLALDGQGFLVVVELAPDLGEGAQEAALDAVTARLTSLPQDLAAVAPGATGIVGADHLVQEELTVGVARDLSTGALLTLPVAAVLVLLVVGGVLAAAVPFAAAAVTLAVGLAALWVVAAVTDVDASVVNVAAVLALGLGLGYGLLVVHRFLDELHDLVDEDDGAGARRRRGDGAVAEAVERTTATAGWTVACSAAVLAAAVGGLLLLGPQVLAAAGAVLVLVVVVAAVAALTLVPAVLAMVGRRLVQPGLLGPLPGVRTLRARAVQRARDPRVTAVRSQVRGRPWWVVAACMLLLGVLVAPASRVDLRVSGTELLPAAAAQRAFLEALAAGYPAASSPAVAVVAETDLEQAQAWAEQVAALDAVASVDAPTTMGSYVVVGVRPAATDPGGAVAQRVVRDVRALDAPFEIWVVGQAAEQTDVTAQLKARAPLAAVAVVVVTLALLLLATGSVALSVAALTTSALVALVGAGALVVVFQTGRLDALLGPAATGGVETSALAIAVPVAFGLSAGGSTALLARVAELHEAGRRTDVAVRVARRRSWVLLTALSGVLVALLGGLVLADLVVLQEIGVALAAAVLLDAIVVRLLLLPGVTTVLAGQSWWGAAWLARLRDPLVRLR